MSLTRVEITDFRCIAQARLDLEPRVNLIVGQNASGKTSLLEAIFFLSCGRSFRAARPEVLVRQGCDIFSVVGRIQATVETVVGVRGGLASTEARIGGDRARGFAELATAVPVQVIDPEVHKLLEEGPARRRRFVDWGVFHVEHGYLGAWRRYQRALRQRAAALKAGAQRPAVAVWDRELIESGEVLTRQRVAYVQDLGPRVSDVARDLLDVEVGLRYLQGWPEGRSLGEALQASWLRDQATGMTAAGPHRADLSVTVDGVPARQRISRGQQKLLAAALVLGQLEQREATAEAKATLLLDDPAAELDPDRLNRFLARVVPLPVQLIVTSLVQEARLLQLAGSVFHVEQGRVARVV